MRVPVHSLLLTALLGFGLALPVMAQAEHAGPSVHRSAHTIQAAHLAGGKPVHHTHHRTVKHKKPHGPSLVHLTVAAGYKEQYRDNAWIPLHITARNRTTATISGIIEVPDASTTGNNQGAPPQPYRALYQMPVVLPASVTKEVTLYMPAAGVNGEVDVQFRRGNQVLGTAYDGPTSFDRGSLSIGALTSDPATIAWINRINPPSGAGISLIRLSPTMVDPLPEALANFDAIVVNDGSVARLNRDQLTALTQYVNNGGALVMIGGPGWQEALKPLPAQLIPGHLQGTTTLPDLLGLRLIQKVSSPPHEAATVVSVLRNPQGTVLASERGVPLAVQNAVGKGQVLYLAFDPALDPIDHWSGAGSILTHLVVGAAPLAAQRNALPQGMPTPSLFFSNFGPSLDIGDELDNVPAAALPSIVLFIILTVFYILVLGPVNFLVLRRFRRRELAWITIPLGAVLCMAATFGVAFHLKGSTVLVNTVGVVTLDGTQGPHPAALYLGLFAPVRGDYNLTFDGTALPQYVPQMQYFGPGPNGPGSAPLGLRFQEGSQTQIQFLGMNMWSMRNAALHTTVNVPGRVLSQLHIDSHGYIVGAVHNDTKLTLLHPSIVAGQSVIHLADMPPEKTIPIRLKPHVNLLNNQNQYQPFWSRLYGQIQCCGGPVFVNHGPICFGCNNNQFQGGMGGPCCYGGSGTPAEHSFIDRIRNVVTQLPEAQSVTAAGEVLFIAWNEQPLGSISVDGTVPRRRDLNLVISPLSVDIAPGPFTLRSGTFGAHAVDIVPDQQSTNGCCGPMGASLIDLGSGGSGTFQFDLPASRRLHFTHLTLAVNAGGADGTDIGRVWDWRASQWVKINLEFGSAQLHQPDRFISPAGAVLVKLVGSYYSSDIRIYDVHTDLQLSGNGVAT